MLQSVLNLKYMTKSGLSAHTPSSDWNVKASIQIATERPTSYCNVQGSRAVYVECMFVMSVCMCRVEKESPNTGSMTGRKSLHTIIACKQNVALGKKKKSGHRVELQMSPKLCTQCEEIWSLNHPYWPIETFPATEILGNYRLSVTATHANRRLTCECCVNTLAVGWMWCSEPAAPQYKV